MAFVFKLPRSLSAASRLENSEYRPFKASSLTIHGLAHGGVGIVLLTLVLSVGVLRSFVHRSSASGWVVLLSLDSSGVVGGNGDVVGGSLGDSARPRALC